MTDDAGQRLSDLLRLAGAYVPVDKTSLFVAEQRRRLLTRIRANGQVPVTDEICMAELGPLIEAVGAAWPVASSVLCSYGNNAGRPFLVRFVRAVLDTTQAVPRLQELLFRDALMEPYYFQIALQARSVGGAADPPANAEIAGAEPEAEMPPAPSVDSDDDVISEVALSDPVLDDPYTDVRAAPMISRTVVEPTCLEVALHYVDAGLASKFAVAVSVGLAVIGGLVNMPVSGRTLAVITTVLTSWRSGVRMTHMVKEHLLGVVSVAIAVVAVMNWWAVLNVLGVVVAGILLAMVVPERWGRAPADRPDDVAADGEDTLFGTTGDSAAANRLPPALESASGGAPTGAWKDRAACRPSAAAAAPVQSSVVGASSAAAWQTALGATGSSSGTGLIGRGAPYGYAGAGPGSPGGGPWGVGGPPFGGGGGPPDGWPPHPAGGFGSPGGASSPYAPPNGGGRFPPSPSPGGGGGGSGPPGGSSDPYAAPRWGSGLLPNLKRMATEIYWNLRSSTSSCREYFAIYFRGDRHGQEYRDLWSVCIGVDDKLELAYRHGGYPGVQHVLATDAMLEHWLTRLGSQINYVRMGNTEMKVALQSSQAPGDCDIIPAWSLQGHRDTLKSEYQAVQRRRGESRGGGTMPIGSSAAGSEDSVAPRRPRRRGTGLSGSASSTNPAGAPAAGGSGGGSTRPPGGRGQRG